MKAIKWIVPAVGLVIFGVPLVASWQLALLLPSLPVEAIAHIPVVGTLLSLLARAGGYWYYIMDAAAAIVCGLRLWYVLRTARSS